MTRRIFRLISRNIRRYFAFQDLLSYETAKLRYRQTVGLRIEESDLSYKFASGLADENDLADIALLGYYGSTSMGYHQYRIRLVTNKQLSSSSDTG